MKPVHWSNQNEGLLSSQPIDCDRLSFKSTRGCQEFQGQESEDVATGGEAAIHVCEGVCTWVYVLHECTYMCKHVCVHECIVSVHACVCTYECAWMHAHALSVWHMCTCVHECQHACTHVHVCAYMCAWVCQCACTCVHEHVRMYVHVWLHVSACAHVCMSVCVHECACICVLCSHSGIFSMFFVSVTFFF